MNTELMEHQEALCAKADEIIGLALRLRLKLRTADSAPLPEDETDVLLKALTDFIKEAQACQR